MLLETLQAVDFRNLQTAALHPSPHATVVVGSNGQGKTNLLEALYFLCTPVSYTHLTLPTTERV